MISGTEDPLPAEAENEVAPRPLIVVVGASIDTMQNIERFFSKLNLAPDQAVVLVLQHRGEALDKNRLQERLQNYGRELSDVREGAPVEGGTIYLCAGDMITTVEDNHFSVRGAEQAPGEPAEIDRFLISLAEDRAEEAIAVVLEGTGVDGALGAAALKKRGALVIAERPRREDPDNLADSKSAAAIADLVLAAEDIPEHIQVYSRHLRRVQELKRFNKERRSLNEELQSVNKELTALNAELQHRIRNALSVVRSIARRSAETSSTVEEYAMHLDGRLNAFARTQALLTRDPGGGVDLEYLLLEELHSYNAREGEQVSVSGPSIRFRPKAAETFALAIHELATNALKYGALSKSGGTIEITWRIEAAGEPAQLIFDWREGNGPSVMPPQRTGFGNEVLERTLAFELDSSTTLAFDPTGLHCTIAVPLNSRLIHIPTSSA